MRSPYADRERRLTCVAHLIFRCRASPGANLPEEFGGSQQSVKALRCYQIEVRSPLCSKVSHRAVIFKALCLRHTWRYHASMRSTYVAAAAGMVIAVLLNTSLVLMRASPAHADISGYGRCVGNIREVPLSQPDTQSLQLARLIEMDLKAGASPAAETQKVARTGFDMRVADGVVQCVMQNNP